VETKLTKIRKRKGHTILQASRIAGVAPASINSAELGKRIPTAKTLAKFSRYYGLSESEIIKIIAILRERRKQIERIDIEILSKLSS